MIFIDYINKIINGESLSVLKELPNNTFYTCITSPPYYGLRDYGVDGQIGLEETPEKYIIKLVEIFCEIKRILKDDGTLWVNIGDSYCGGGRGCDTPKQKTNRGTENMPHSTIPDKMKSKDLMGIPWMLAFALRNDGWYLRQDIIWAKPNPMPESVKDRCTKSHEYIFMLSKSKNYYYDNEAIKEPCVNGDPTSPRGSKGCDTKNSGLRKQDAINKRRYTGFNERYQNEEKREYRNKRDVWTITPKPLREAHFATFPPDLIEPCILAGCPAGGLVIDPFMGSGTTGIVAKQLNRNFTGIEINTTYCDMANKRIQDIA